MGPSERPLPLGFNWPNKRVPVAFIDVSPSPSSSTSSISSSNSPSSLSASEDVSPLSPSLALPRSRILQYESYSSSNASKSKSFSYSNLAEAEVLCGVVQGLLDKGTLLSQVEQEPLTLFASSPVPLLLSLFLLVLLPVLPSVLVSMPIHICAGFGSCVQCVHRTS